MLKSIWAALIWLLFSHHLSAQAPVFANDKLNVVYIGIDNPISLYYNKPYDTVTTTNGSLSKISDGHYIWWPKEYRKSCLVLRSANGDSLAAAYFRVKRLPIPTPKLGGVIGSGLVSLREFKAQEGIMAYRDNFDVGNIRLEVVGFNITHRPREGDIKVYYNKGARFDDKAKDLIKVSKMGDTYAFENIQYKDIDGTVFGLPNLIITIW